MPNNVAQALAETDAAQVELAGDSLGGGTDRVDSHLHPEGSFDVDYFEVPRGREEIWRFSPLRRLRGLHADAPFGGEDFTIDVSGDARVSAGPVALADSGRGRSGLIPTDRISARVWASGAQVYTVVIPREADVLEPTVVTVRGTASDAASAPAVAGQLLVEAEPFSRATVVVRYEGSATWADNVEVVVGDGAQLTFVSVQDWADDAVHATSHRIRVGRDAHLKHVAVSLGGEVVRMDTTLDYAGPGGSADLLGLYFADEGQHLEHRLFVDHNAPQTTSNVDYRGALQGHGAHTVWIGNVLIRKIAEGIQTYESNRNLVLTDGARADSVPNLEIETGEIVGAGHASTTGRFDDEQLFYLQSRGVPEEEARRLVVYGFFADIIRRIGVPAVEQGLLSAIEAELSKNVSLAPVSTIS